ncbi:Flp family type IVb pilin [Aquabacterium sp. A08]|uniref:Flp family type IVb pilin n=1 Tax=Aquabacterium sp. A08 TaxID=2718532 RepID=UPI00141F7846|nr:Flp family type IVb pilin [Aquabacterium sp. A08]NIC40997.1 Flp family type IVb pilin [Aquabacterium sp. A08]
MKGINMRTSIRRLGRQEMGATALEYAVIAGILVVALIAIFTTLGGGIETLFNDILSKLGVGGT